MRKSHFNDEFLVLLGPTISRLFTCSNEEKTKGACSSAISMVIMNVVMLNVVALEKNDLISWQQHFFSLRRQSA
jgi:hypothetical protein